MSRCRKSVHKSFVVGKDNQEVTTASAFPCVIGDEPNCEEQFCHCKILFSWEKETILSKNRLFLLGKNEDIVVLNIQ